MGLEPMASSLPRTRSTTELQQQYAIRHSGGDRSKKQQIYSTSEPKNTNTPFSRPINLYRECSNYYSIIFNIKPIIYENNRKSANTKSKKNAKKFEKHLDFYKNPFPNYSRINSIIQIPAPMTNQVVISTTTL